MPEAMLIERSAAERRALLQAMDTPSARHAAMVAAPAQMPAPWLMASDDRLTDKAEGLQFRIAYLRSIFDAIKPVFEMAIDDAIDCCSAQKIDRFDFLEAMLTENIIAGMDRAMEELREPYEP